MEVQYAQEPFAHLISQTVRLRWDRVGETDQRFRSVTRSVEFDEDALRYIEKGFVLPERVNHWQDVNPFESLAGAYPVDEMIVRLPEPVVVDETPEDNGPPILYLSREPLQTTGRFYALVQFLSPENGATDQERWRVAHFRRETGVFDGPQETVLLLETMPDEHDVHPAVSHGISDSPANEEGWYIYGALNRDGVFVVQSLMPRALMRLRPQQTRPASPEETAFYDPREWRKQAPPGTFASLLLYPKGVSPEEEVARWQEGDTALVVHLYGRYLRKDQPWMRLALVWGHFAFGVARVVREPLTGELRFDIEYHQVYVDGEEGIISGTHHWTRYTGDRQFGFMGTHPIQDVLIRLDCFTEPYPLSATMRSPLAELSTELEKMEARYRIADGRGGTRISASNNCSQDSNQALYAALKHIDNALRSRPSEQTGRAEALDSLKNDLKHKLLPFGAARADWEENLPTIGSSLSENLVSSLSMAARTWNTVLPSIAARSLVKTFLQHGATAWTLRTHNVGGQDPTIVPFPPNV